LSGEPAPDAVSATRRLLAVQAQDPRGARLAVRARSAERSVAAFERALSDERSLLITWLNRGTLHLVSAEDYPWLHALTTPPVFTANARRLEQEGVSETAAERAMKVISGALANEGPQTRQGLKARLDDAGVRTEGQALMHLLLLANLRGIAVRGPMVGRQHAYALVRDWLGEPSPVDRERALAELARRYLAGHAPAGERDLARWAGLPLRDARAGLGAIAAELDQRPDGQLTLAARRPDGAVLAPPRLLGSFEPVLLGWSSREFVTGPHAGRVAVGGLFRPFALVGGQVAALWRLAGAQVEIEPLRGLADHEREALEADGKRLVAYLAAE
jgi:hypothetical protein